MWLEYKNTGYYVSTYGEVYTPSGKYLKPYPRGNGYLGVDIAGKKMLLHRLVAEVFLTNPNNLEIVNHIDGNKHNDEVWNLEWCDRSYNQIHAYKNGLQKKKFSKNNPLSKPVLMMNSNMEVIREFDSLTDAASFVGLKTYSNISRCIRGERNTAKGYYWKFKY